MAKKKETWKKEVDKSKGRTYIGKCAVERKLDSQSPEPRQINSLKA
jgi:hypothetical protein